jgi:UDP-N-acetylmuramate dehydrogenase
MFENNHYEKNKFSDVHLIQEYVPLADKNTFRTGGKARFYAEPKTTLEFQQALQFADLHDLEIFVLGGGANLLIHDDGFEGLVIKPMLQDITFTPSSTYQEKTTVTVGAGVSIDQIIQTCFKHNRIGLEEFSGIPGNIGGAVFINLHYYEFSLEDFLLSARIIHKKTGEIITVDTAWFQFGYDQSKLQNQEYFVLDATFQVTYVDDLTIAHAKGRSEEIIRHRRKRYPYENTCGSFFRNFHPEEVINTEKKLIFVAYYLDQLGVKGTLSVGGAIVSHQHANMIVNYKQGTSADIVTLAQRMQQMVYERYQIIPQPECQLLGFKNNPFVTLPSQN